MKQLILGLSMASLASLAAAEDIRSVKVWFDSEKAPVYDDYRFAPGTDLQVFDLATSRNANETLNQQILDQGVQYGSNLAENVQIAQTALEHYRQTPEYEAHVEEMKSVGAAVHEAIKYNITKVPAVLFNENYTVIGETSLADAVRIFHQEVQ